MHEREACRKQRINVQKTGRFHLLVMNLFLASAIILWTLSGLLLFPGAYLAMRTIGRRSTRQITRWCIWVYGRVWQFFTRAFVTFERARYRPSHFTVPGIIVVNHRSFFDTYCMNMLPVWDVCFAVRDWPFRIPVYNLFMEKAGYMNIEKFSWDKSLHRSKQTLNCGGFVLFFPEGHRNSSGRMTRFHSGAFKMAVETGAPVIPVCLTGTQDLLPRERWHMAPARVKMKVLDPIFPETFQGEMKHQAMKKKVKQLMAHELSIMDGITEPTEKGPQS